MNRADDALGRLSTAQLRAAFDGVEDLTIGLEEEVLLVDPQSFELVPRAAQVLDRIGAGDLFKLELPAAQLEILTPPSATVADAAAVLRRGRTILVDRCGDLAAALAAGIHPSAEREGELNRGPRYDAIRDDYRLIARRQLVCALQVHVAVRGASRALAVYNALRCYLPEIAALAANAPFEAGIDTGLASVRPTISAMLPRQGVPPRIDSWEDLATQLRWGAVAGSVPEPRRWWWELRPHVSYGTLEVRVADAQITTADAAGIAAFVHSLVGWLASRHEAGEQLAVAAGWRIAENSWSACRDGIEGSLADLETGARVGTGERLGELCDVLAPTAARLRCSDELSHAAALARRNGAVAQREFAATHGVAALAPWLSACFAASDSPTTRD